jgi:hypothetical protein
VKQSALGYALLPAKSRESVRRCTLASLTSPEVRIYLKVCHIRTGLLLLTAQIWPDEVILAYRETHPGNGKMSDHVHTRYVLNTAESESSTPEVSDLNHFHSQSLILCMLSIDQQRSSGSQSCHHGYTREIHQSRRSRCKSLCKELQYPTPYIQTDWRVT